MEYWFWALPVITGASIGWITNWLAIRMLFRPRRPILGVQGLLPRRRTELIERIARTVADELISADQLLEPLTRVDLSPHLERVVQEALDRRLADLRSIPLIGSLLSVERLSGVQRAITAELSAAAPRLLDTLRQEGGKRIDIAAMVRERLDGFDLSHLERIIQSVASREMRTIEWWGAILGGLVGLIQAALLAALS
jgi:uncharacterized membrane protein YheB (UPF0754 family)